MRFTVGGREFDLTPEQVRMRMKGVEPKPIHKYVVDIDNTGYPPKQVFGTCVEFPMTSFTTMDANRVLNKLGFICREAGTGPDGSKSGIGVTGGEDPDASNSGPQTEISSIQAALITLQMALAHLDQRVMALENGGSHDAS